MHFLNNNLRNKVFIFCSTMSNVLQSKHCYFIVKPQGVERIKLINKTQFHRQWVNLLLPIIDRPQVTSITCIAPFPLTWHIAPSPPTHLHHITYAHCNRRTTDLHTRRKCINVCLYIYIYRIGDRQCLIHVREL